MRINVLWKDSDRVIERDVPFEEILPTIRLPRICNEDLIKYGPIELELLGRPNRYPDYNPVTLQKINGNLPFYKEI